MEKEHLGVNCSLCLRVFSFLAEQHGTVFYKQRLESQADSTIYYLGNLSESVSQFLYL